MQNRNPEKRIANSAQHCQEILNKYRITLRYRKDEPHSEKKIYP
jgi:hypothetical protein